MLSSRPTTTSGVPSPLTSAIAGVGMTLLSWVGWLPTGLVPAGRSVLTGQPVTAVPLPRHASGHAGHRLRGHRGSRPLPRRGSPPRLPVPDGAGDAAHQCPCLCRRCPRKPLWPALRVGGALLLL